MSYAEDLFEESLKLVVPDSVVYLRNHRPDWLKNYTGRNLEYDFYIPQFNIAFEIQGQHHYDSSAQQERDRTKKELSESIGIAIFELSIFQIDPATIRRKLLSYFYTIRSIFSLKPYDKDRYAYQRNKVRAYKTQSLNSYGLNHCHKNPSVFKHLQIRKLIFKFVKINHTFEMIYQDLIRRTRFVSLNKESVLIELSGGLRTAIGIKKFYNSVIGLGAENGFDRKTEMRVA